MNPTRANTTPAARAAEPAQAAAEPTPAPSTGGPADAEPTTAPTPGAGRTPRIATGRTGCLAARIGAAVRAAHSASVPF